MIKKLFYIFATILYFHNMVHAAEVENSAVDVCDCPGIENFADDIHGVLTNLYLSNQTAETQETFAKIDNLKLLLTVQRDANGVFTCEESTKAYFNEGSTSKVSLLRSGMAELGVVSNQLNLQPTRPDLIHLASGGKREMFFLGRIDGQEVYFHLVIDHNGDAKINYLPIKKEASPAFVSRSQVKLKDNNAASIARNGIDKTQEVENLNWQLVDTKNNQPVVAVDTSETSTSTKFYLRNKDNSSVYTISGNVKNLNEEPTAGPVGIQYQNKGESTEVRIGTSIDPSVEEPTPRFNGGVTQVIAPKVKASLSGETTGPEDVKSKSALNLGDENLSLTLSADTENEFITRREAKLKAKRDILSGELGVISSERGETVSGKGGIDVTDATTLTSNFVLDPSYEKFGVGAEYTGKTDDGDYKVGCEANVRIVNEEQYTITPKVHFQSNSGQKQKQKHRISCETGPIINENGLVGVEFKTQYDYKIADTTSVGVYVHGTSYHDGRAQDRDLALGLQGKIKFGGAPSSVKKLKVHTLVDSKIEQKFGEQLLIGYYKTTGYTCDTKRKTVKTRNESSRNRRHWFKVAVDPGTPLAPVVYSPADQRPETFCVFAK